MAPFRWSAYEDFAKLIRARHRFVPNLEMREFLDEVRRSSRRRARKLTAGRVLWRARIGCVETIIPTSTGSITQSEPYAAEAMVPNSTQVGIGGRGNPPS